MLGFYAGVVVSGLLAVLFKRGERGRSRSHAKAATLGKRGSSAGFRPTQDTADLEGVTLAAGSSRDKGSDAAGWTFGRWLRGDRRY